MGEFTGKETYFSHTVSLERSWSKGFATWRTYVDTNADALADFLIASVYPSTGLARVPAKADLARKFTSRVMRPSCADVFKPFDGIWTGRWKGTGTNQYHVWDATDTAGIQYVTQSESKTVDGANIAAMHTSSPTAFDIAINVVRTGCLVTGWVSKRQHGEQELPHVGYPIDASTLLWVAQIHGGGSPAIHTRSFFVFLEWTNGTTSPSRYSIEGRQVELQSGAFVVADKDRHYGRYSRVAVPAPTP